jgi:hypothetical protein
MLISRISRRISSGTVGRPPRGRDFQRQFDAAIERDARAGKLDAHADEALAAHRAGRSRELCGPLTRLCRFRFESWPTPIV